MIIIRDETLGQSFSFVITREGYYAADAKIQEIASMGHKVGGGVAKDPDLFIAPDSTKSLKDIKSFITLLLAKNTKK